MRGGASPPLCYVVRRGRTPDEIAARYGIPVLLVLKDLQRALKALRATASVHSAVWEAYRRGLRISN